MTSRKRVGAASVADESVSPGRSGGPPGIRTPNLRIKSPLLCRIELEARITIPIATPGCPLRTTISELG
jgi:hypothetical protein